MTNSENKNPKEEKPEIDFTNKSTATSMKAINIGLIGFGTVGAGVVHVLTEQLVGRESVAHPAVSI